MNRLVFVSNRCILLNDELIFVVVVEINLFRLVFWRLMCELLIKGSVVIVFFV